MRTSMTMVMLKQWLFDEMTWEKRREKRKINAKRGEARKLLKRKMLGLDIDEAEIEWAKSYLAMTGGDREMGIMEAGDPEDHDGANQQLNMAATEERKKQGDGNEKDDDDLYGEDLFGENLEAKARMVARAEMEVIKHEAQKTAKAEAQNEDLTQISVRGIY